MSVKFGPWLPSDALHVLLNMRRNDEREIYATRHNDSWSEHFVDLTALAPQHAWLELVYEFGEPVAVFGVVETGPGTGCAHMFGTNDLTPKATRQLVRRVHRTIMPAVLGPHFHRVEALSLATYEWSHRFICACGGVLEGTRAQMGRNGEDFKSFIWLHKES